MVRVTVYGQPDLTTDVRVSENGTINFPLIGDVKLAGVMGIYLGWPGILVSLFVLNGARKILALK